MKKDDFQTTNQLHLLNQKNALKSKNTIAKWQGLDKITVNLPIFSVKVHAVLPLPQEASTLLDHDNNINNTKNYTNY
jgi:hypothetical protein